MWQVAWAHPKYGHILASCSYDGKVLIWKEQQGGSGAGGWIKIKEHTLHTASGNFEILLRVIPQMARTLSPIYSFTQLTLFHGRLMNLVPSLPVRLQMGKFRF